MEDNRAERWGRRGMREERYEGEGVGVLAIASNDDNNISLKS